jgi:hypothetical protein
MVSPRKARDEQMFSGMPPTAAGKASRAGTYVERHLRTYALTLATSQRHVAMPSRFFRFFRDELAEVVGCAHIGKEHFHPGICDAI